MRDTEARAVVRNKENIVVVLIKQLPLYNDPPRFELILVDNDDDNGEVLASGLLYKMIDASADCWLDGFRRGYDDGYQRGIADTLAAGPKQPGHAHKAEGQGSTNYDYECDPEGRAADHP